MRHRLHDPAHPRPTPVLRHWWAAGVAAVLMYAAAAEPVRSQTITRDFSVCFTSGVRSCTALTLATTAFYTDGGGRIGTAVDVYVRHDEGSAPGAAVVSALTGFYFAYAGAAVTPTSGADVSDESGLVSSLVLPEGDAPFPLNAGGWSHTARSSTTTSATPTFDTYLAFTNVLSAFDDATATVGTQYIGGCGAADTMGALDAVYRTELWTCGDSRYWFTTFTDAWFDADQVHTVGVTTYARFDGSELGVAAFCDRYLDTDTSFGDADGTFTSFGDVCGADAPDGGSGGDPGTPVSEPSTLWLVAAAGVVFGLHTSGRRAGNVS